MNEMTSTCLKCNILKPSISFSKGRKQCKMCINETSRGKTLLRRESLNQCSLNATRRDTTCLNTSVTPPPLVERELVGDESLICLPKEQDDSLYTRVEIKKSGYLGGEIELINVLEIKCSQNMFHKWITSNFFGDMDKDNHGLGWLFDWVVPIRYMYLMKDLHPLLLGWFNVMPVVYTNGFRKCKTITAKVARDHLSNLNSFIQSEGIDITSDIERYINILTEIKFKGVLESLPSTLICTSCKKMKQLEEYRCKSKLCIDCKF
jgi:hypothetical protein